MIPQRYQNCAVRSQKYKLVSKHGTKKERNTELPLLKPEFELYDIENDPGEKDNIARTNPEIVDRMQGIYETWLNEMRQTREFEPGWILIGSNHENPMHLCRYQDSHYTNGTPQGWPVKIIQAGKYEIAINRSGYIGKGRLSLKINNYNESHDLEHGINKAVFTLPETTGLLDIWFEEMGKERIIFKKNHTIGDVDLRQL